MAMLLKDTRIPVGRNMARLVAADVRMVFRDPLLAIMPFAPFLAAAALRFAFPVASSLIEGATGFRLLDYADMARVVITLFPGMFFGMIAGFLLLDDRDDGVSMYWGATPVGRSGYLTARLGLFSAAAMVAGLLCGRVLGLGRIDMARELGVAVLGALQVPFFALFLAAFAADKVEGLSILKALGGLDIAPIAIYLRLPARLIAWPFPQYWAAELALGKNIQPAIALALGLMASAIWMAALSLTYRKRID